MLDQETKRKIDSARDILVGKVPDPKAQVEQITIALIYKFMDDMDKEAEELGGKAKFFTNGYEKYSWSKLMDKRLSGEERTDLYVHAISEMPKNQHIPQIFRDVFKDAFLPFRDSETLNLFLKEIDGFTYDHSENLGNAFEYLLSILGSQGDAGQFRTPRHIIDFMVEVVNPKKNETILDPACGTAGFLISAYKHIIKHNSSNFKPKEEKAEEKIKEGETATEIVLEEKETYRGDKLSPTEKKKLMENITGYDISPDMVKLSLVNLYLHGFSNPKIYEYDTLSSEKHWDETFDVILANPPFMTPKGGIRPHKRFSVQAKRAEVLFVDYILEHLNQKGRAGIIVPEGVIFKTETAYKQLRQMLVEDGLFAVVSLPAGVFQPYSGVKTSILFFDNNLAKKAEEILFVKIENDGFDLGAQRRKVEGSDLPEALDILDAWKQGKKKESDIALWVKKDKIAESGDYNLTGERYRETELQFINSLREQVEKDLEKHKKILEPTIKQVDEFINSPQFQTMQKSIQEAVSHFQQVIRDVDLQRILSAFEEVRQASNQKWPLVELKEVANIDWGNTELTKKSYIEGGKFLGVSAAGCDGRMDHFEHEVGVTVLSAIGANCGRVFYPTEKFTAIKNTITFTPDRKKLEPKYLFYIMKSNALPKRGGGQPFMSKGDVEKYKIPLPSLEIQKEIVEQIEVKQKAIDAAKEVIKNLERERRYFGQELRKLEDVEWVELGKVAEVISGQSPESKYYNEKEEGLPFYQGKTEFTEMYIGEPSTWTTKTTKLAEKGDILMSVRAPVGPVNIATQKICIGRGLAAIRPNKVEPMYLFNFLKSIEDQVKGSGGAVFDSINRGQIEKIKIPVPSSKIQKQLVAESEKEEEIIASNHRLIELMEKKIDEVLDNI